MQLDTDGYRNNLFSELKPSNKLPQHTQQSCDLIERVSARGLFLNFKGFIWKNFTMFYCFSKILKNNCFRHEKSRWSTIFFKGICHNQQFFPWNSKHPGFFVGRKVPDNFQEKPVHCWLSKNSDSYYSSWIFPTHNCDILKISEFQPGFPEYTR